MKILELTRTELLGQPKDENGNLIASYAQRISQCMQLTGQKLTDALEKNFSRIVSEGKHVDYFKRSLFDKNNPNFIEVPKEKEYVDKLTAINKEFANLDANKKPIMINSIQGDINPELKDEFNASEAALKNKYPKTISAIESRDKKFYDYMDEKVKIEFHCVERKETPENMTAQQKFQISFMLVDSLEDVGVKLKKL